MPGFLVWVAFDPVLLCLFLDDLCLGLLVDRGNLVHVCECCLQLGVRLEFLFSDSKEFSDVDSFTRIAIDDFKEALRRNAVVLGWVVPLTFVCLHLLLKRVKLLGSGGRDPLGFPTALVRRLVRLLSEAKKLLHFPSSL